MAKPITDIAGAANLQLRSLKKIKQVSKFTSKIKDEKHKRLAEEIVAEVLSELGGSDDFNLQLQNKITDVILGRITYQKADTDITLSDLDLLKDDVVEGISKSNNISEEMKQLASKCASLVIDNALPSDNSKEVIKQIKQLSDKIEDANAQDQQEAPKKDDKKPEKPAILQTDDPVKAKRIEGLLSDINLFKGTIENEFKKTGNLTNKLTKVVMSPIKAALTTLRGTSDAIKSAMDAATKAMTAPFKLMSKAITSSINAVSKAITAPFSAMSTAVSKSFSAIGNAFKNAKNAVKDGLAAPFKMFKKGLSALNPLNWFKRKKKNKGITKKLTEFFNKCIDKVLNFGEHVSTFLKTKSKKIAKTISAIVSQIIDLLVEVLVTSLKVIFEAIVAGIAILLESMVQGVVQGINASIGWIIWLIAGIILAVAVVVTIILFKFPEFCKPLIEVIPKIIDLFGTLIDFIITKLWNFFKNEIWPFLSETLWPFFRYTIWPFFVEKVFPIVEMMVNFIFGTVWPFLHEKVWPFLSETISKIIDFVLTKVWPFLRDTLTWIKDVIITPIWGLVVTFLKWIVEKIIPFIEQYVAPVLALILEILNTLLQALKPFIRPLVDVVFTVIDWVFDIMYEVDKVLRPVYVTIAEIISTILVVVFEAIDAVVSPILKWLQKQLITLKNLWNSFVDGISTMELFGRKPFAFLAGCKFDVNKPPSGSSGSSEAPAPQDDKKKPSEFIQNLVNGIVNATEIVLGAIEELVWEQVKKKIKNIFNFLRGKEEAEAQLDQTIFNNQVNTDESLKTVNIVLEKLQNILKSIDLMQKALAAVVKEICGVDINSEVEKMLKENAEAQKEAEEKQEESASAFNLDEFIDELTKDTEEILSTDKEVAEEVEQTVETAQENAVDFLQNCIMPLLSDQVHIPLLDILEQMQLPDDEQTEVNAAVLPAVQNEPNPAMSDQ